MRSEEKNVVQKLDNNENENIIIDNKVNPENNINKKEETESNNGEDKNSPNTSGIAENKPEIKEENQMRTQNYKVILLGDSGVGKTSIFNKFLIGEFNTDYQCTLNCEYKTKLIKIDKSSYAKLTIWDTVGSEKYRSITRQYFRGADGVLLIFDLTEEISFNNLIKWLNDIRDFGESYTEIIIVGNKSDLENRKVSYDQAQKFVKDNGYTYFETSAKEGTNILLIFEGLAFEMSRRADSGDDNILLNSQSSYIARRVELNKKLLDDRKNASCC